MVGSFPPACWLRAGQRGLSSPGTIVHTTRNTPREECGGQPRPQGTASLGFRAKVRTVDPSTRHPRSSLMLTPLWIGPPTTTRAQHSSGHGYPSESLAKHAACPCATGGPADPARCRCPQCAFRHCSAPRARAPPPPAVACPSTCARDPTGGYTRQPRKRCPAKWGATLAPAAQTVQGLSRPAWHARMRREVAQ